MKNTFTLLLILLTAAVTKAQVIDTVSIQPGYTHQSYYSLSNGGMANPVNTDWDLAFQNRGFAASILINSKNNVRLFKTNKSVADWASMSASDTTGILSNPSYELFNSDTSWDFGAFNRTNDTANAFDLGWGYYDFITHAITGDSVYFIILPNMAVKKLKIDNLSGGIYNFRWADLDGANEVVANINKANFLNKFFAYYSITNSTSIDREPLYNSWDLLFTQYLTTTPFTYKVTGVLLNDSVQAVRSYPVDVQTAGIPSYNDFSSEINRIGFAWKSFDLSTNSWLIEDSMVYFIQDRNLAVWKLIFTGFGGSSNGNFIFTKENLGITSVEEPGLSRLLALYPNPSSGNARLVLDNLKAQIVQISLYDSRGSRVYFEPRSLDSGLQNLDFDFSSFPQGMYLLVVDSEGGRNSQRLVLN